MEAPDPCFAFNFRRANGASRTRVCRARSSGTSPERGQGKHTPSTPNKASCSLPGVSAALLCLDPGAPLGAGSFHGCRSLRTSGLGREAARRGAGCRHGLPRGELSCL